MCIYIALLGGSVEVYTLMIQENVCDQVKQEWKALTIKELTARNGVINVVLFAKVRRSRMGTQQEGESRDILGIVQLAVFKGFKAFHAKVHCKYTVVE